MNESKTRAGDEPRTFRVDLRGVIALLSSSLYSSPGVYVRELMQNAMDAVVAREALGDQDAARIVAVSPFGVASPGSAADRLSVTDSGIGMNLEQIDQLLATVGASSKKEDLEQGRRSYIGQFGIGLLSCFLVADEITVISRSATGGEPIEWIGRSDGTYELRTLDGDLPIGTTVELRPRPDMVGWARAEQVTPLVRKFAEFLPAEITVLTNQGPMCVSRRYDWLPDFGAHRDEVLSGASPRLGGVGVGRQFDAVEVEDRTLGLHAVVYIGAPAGRPSSTDRNRIYVNDMLVDDDDGSLMPRWAFFAWAVITSTLLQPTASRETLMRDSAHAQTRQKLGQAVLKWLHELAETDPERFARFVAENQLEFKLAATKGFDRERLELAEVVLPQLTVQTTQGQMRLVDLAARNPSILFAGFVQEFRTIASFNPKGRTVVNAGHTLDQEVLLALPRVMPGVTVTRVYPASEAAALVQPRADAGGDVLELERRATLALAAQECDVVVRQFPSTELPAVFIDRGQVHLPSPGYADSAHLVVNWDNRVIRALVGTRDEVVFTRVVQLLFVQARMAGQYDAPDDRALLSAALDDILLLAVGVEGTEV